jgi:hypothetical protein
MNISEIHSYNLIRIRFHGRVRITVEVVRPKMRPFDLFVGDSFDARESVDEPGECLLICAESDGPIKHLIIIYCVRTNVLESDHQK